MKVEAIILAGAPADDFGDSELTSRAMVKLCDKPMLDWVAEPVFNCKSISRTCVVGNVVTDFSDVILEPAEDIVSNIKRCLEEFVTGDYVLLVTSDIPLIDSDCITDFINEAELTDADFVYPICRKEVCEELYPELKRTYVKIDDGEFTGGNIMLMKKSFLIRVMPILSRLFEARKSPLKLAKVLGLGVVFKLILSRFDSRFLDIDYLEGTAGSILGSSVKAVITASPEICEDLDHPEDVVLFEDILMKRDV